MTQQNKLQHQSGVKIIRPSTIVNVDSFIDDQKNFLENESPKPFNHIVLPQKHTTIIKREQIIQNQPQYNTVLSTPTPTHQHIQPTSQKGIVQRQQAIAHQRINTNQNHLYLLTVNSNGSINQRPLSISPTAMSSASIGKTLNQKQKSRTNLVATLQHNPYQIQTALQPKTNNCKNQKGQQSTGRVQKASRYPTGDQEIKTNGFIQNRAQSNPKQFMGTRTNAQLKMRGGNNMTSTEQSQLKAQQRKNIDYQQILSNYQAETLPVGLVTCQRGIQSPEFQEMQIINKLSENKNVSILKHLNSNDQNEVAVLFQDQSTHENHKQQRSNSTLRQLQNRKASLVNNKKDQESQHAIFSQTLTALQPNQQVSEKFGNSSNLRIQPPIIPPFILTKTQQQKLTRNVLTQQDSHINQNKEIQMSPTNYHNNKRDGNSPSARLQSQKESEKQFRQIKLKPPTNVNQNNDTRNTSLLPMSKSIVLNNRVALQSFNRYNHEDIILAERFDSEQIYQPQLEQIYLLEDSSKVVPKYNVRMQKNSGVSEPTAATSNQNYLTQFDGELNMPKSFNISNQNALLSLMSHDDLEGIKNQIHTHINKIDEVNAEEEDAEQQTNVKRLVATQRSVGKEDDEGQVVQGRLRSRRMTVL